METIAWVIIIAFVVAGFLCVVDSAGGPGGCLLIAAIVCLPILVLGWACSTILETPCEGYYSDSGEPCD